MIQPLISQVVLCLSAVAAGPELTLVDPVLEQSSAGGAFDLALLHPVDVVVTGQPGDPVLLFASVNAPPDPPPRIGGVPLGVDPATMVLLVNGLADPAAVIGPGGEFRLTVTVPVSLPPGGKIHLQGATAAAPLPSLTPGLVLTVVDARIFDFHGGAEGFVADLSDYHAFQLPGMNPKAFLSVLPPPLDGTEPAFYVEVQNSSDDAFLFLKRRIDGLSPSTPRALRIEVRFASMWPEDSVGAGGSPGASVYMKAGGSTIEPKPVPLTGDPQHIVLNLDKGNQAVGGSDLGLIGNVATPAGSVGWMLLENRMKDAQVVTSDAQGGLWICVGTDSGYEGLNQLYYDRIVVKLLD